VQLRHHLVFVSIVALGVLGSGSGHAAPVCAQPAPLNDGSRTSPQGFVVTIKASVKDPSALVSALEGRHHFKATHYGWYGKYASFFVFDVPPQLIDALRCEPDVESVTYEALVYISALAPNNRWRGP